MGGSPGAKILVGLEKEGGLVQAAASSCKDASATHNCTGGMEPVLIFTPGLFMASFPLCQRQG